jgi:hypothetical protein
MFNVVVLRRPSRGTQVVSVFWHGSSQRNSRTVFLPRFEVVASPNRPAEN